MCPRLELELVEGVGKVCRTRIGGTTERLLVITTSAVVSEVSTTSSMLLSLCSISSKWENRGIDSLRTGQEHDHVVCLGSR